MIISIFILSSTSDFSTLLGYSISAFGIKICKHFSGISRRLIILWYCYTVQYLSSTSSGIEKRSSLFFKYIKLIHDTILNIFLNFIIVLLISVISIYDIDAIFPIFKYHFFLITGMLDKLLSTIVFQRIIY